MLITETALHNWVLNNEKKAEVKIVELVSRLISASCPDIERKRIPLGDGTNQVGPDCFLIATTSTSHYVPAGQSIWEIGTGSRAYEKATEDYKKRTAEIPKEERLKSMFVFVTPHSGRNWQFSWKEGAQQEWLDNRKKKNEWKDVRIIDGTVLVDWINHFWAVESWFNSVLGIPENQIMIPELHWESLSKNNERHLLPIVFTVGREAAQERINDLLIGNASQIKLVTYHPDQVNDFIAAHLASLEEKEREAAYAKCLFVSGIESWNVICEQYRDHILVATPPLDLSTNEGGPLLRKAMNAGHRVVYAGLPGGIPTDYSVALPNPTIDELVDPLVKSGYDFEQAYLYARRSGGNLVSLLKMIQRLPLTPSWSRGDHVQDLGLAVMLGAWVDSNKEDRKLIEEITGKKYTDWMRQIRQAAHVSGTPLVNFNGRWVFTIRYEGWYALGPSIYDEHLGRLKEAAVRMLREKDPKFELPKEERYAAQAYGKILPHSTPLRNGIASCLALLGGQSSAITSMLPADVEKYARLAVIEILRDADWTIWASLNEELPLLAEAAPRQFIEAVEDALRMDPCPFDIIFSQEGSGTFGSNYMSGVLWALETLAWNPDYFSNVMMILAALAERDPGGNWANRPGNSIKAILMPWCPQTLASFEKRYAAISRMLESHPNVGWKILFNLLPEYHSISAPVRRPTWRNWIPNDWTIRVRPQEYRDQIMAFSELAINKAANNIERSVDICGRLADLPPSIRKSFLDYLSSEKVITIDEKDRVKIWNALVTIVRTHRMYIDAEWALDAKEIDAIEAVANTLAPEQPCFLYKRLFDLEDIDLFTEIGEYEEQRKRIEIEREQAILGIYDQGGIKAILDFNESVNKSFEVGFAAGSIVGEDSDIAILPEMLLSEEMKNRLVAIGFVNGRFHKNGWGWVDHLEKKEWTPDQIAKFLSILPFNIETWNRSGAFLGDCVPKYWEKATVNPHEAGSDIEEGIDKLLKNGRPLEALNCLYFQLNTDQNVNSTRALAALNSSLEFTDQMSSLSTYEITEIIEHLQDDPSTDPNGLLLVEWAYLPLLRGDREVAPKTLERKLSTESDFYCELIRLAFRPHKEDIVKKEPTENEKKLAENAYHLLNDWKVVPGLKMDGHFDGATFVDWLNSVKESCTKSGHLTCAMHIFGQTLVHSPPDSDGLWVHRTIAAALDAEDSEDLRRGYYIGSINSRGAHWVDPTGKDEKERAMNYRKKADELDTAGYPRFASILRDLAEDNERETDVIVSKMDALEHPF